MTSGGGAGGSIYVVADLCFGHGSLKADGGDGQGNGGGGAGGRVSAYCKSMKNLNATMTAYGGDYWSNLI